VSRGHTKGKYDTREALIRAVLFFYYETEQSQAQVARTTGVSEGVVSYILTNHSGEKQR